MSNYMLHVHSKMHYSYIRNTLSTCFTVKLTRPKGIPTWEFWNYAISISSTKSLGGIPNWECEVLKLQFLTLNSPWEISDCLGSVRKSILQNHLKHMQDNMIDQVQYKQWTSTDRSNLDTKVADFLDSFLSGLQKLLPHDFIAKQQAGYLGDFVENYSFVVQDAAQSFQWNNLQATIHPLVCYYRRDVLDEIPEHTSFVIISECNIHDTVAVHLFQKLLIQFLTDKLGQHLKRICYFSDGCAAQYKNWKNLTSVSQTLSSLTTSMC